MAIEEMLCEIERQINNITHLQKHLDTITTIMHETPEYCRGALTMLKYLKTYIERNLQ